MIRVVVYYFRGSSIFGGREECMVYNVWFGFLGRVIVFGLVLGGVE